ncbi:hypothetical protein [Nocardiopsis suaedae]|uniref:Uncharacterized protein n=1 Tax=Nocardiopsis suaedae TaxID=3018444 RepID=A0ABT4TQ56_9ACTN|nr:hypothetical protein [Nocardiopsis suaedae]MDA2806812.1 hypothetical protein [Nocardiopsis suaedae]
MNIEGNTGKILLLIGLAGVIVVVVFVAIGNASGRPECGDYDRVNGEYVYRDDRGDYEKENGEYIYVGCSSNSRGSSGHNNNSGSSGGGFFSSWGGSSRDGSGFRGGGPGFGK